VAGRTGGLPARPEQRMEGHGCPNNSDSGRRAGASPTLPRGHHGKHHLAKCLSPRCFPPISGLRHVMLKQNRGSVINTASIAGLMGSPDIAVYSASKHAVIGLTKSAALECAGTGVRVNCVCPGLIDSRMLSAIIDGRNPGNAPVPIDRVVERIPVRRLGQASEVACIVAFLASDDASYVSGSAYTVDGARTAG